MVQNRANLKSLFQTGAKPTQQNFADFIDSVVNKQDDGMESDNSRNITVGKGITLNNSGLETPGTIRWNGTTFQFRDNAGWKDLGSGSGSQWTSVNAGPDINLLSGNVGIGLPVATNPTYKLEVELASVASTANQVRFGNSVVFSLTTGGYFSHKAQANSTSYAIAQDANGQTVLNAATGKKILFTEANAPGMAITGGVVCIGATAPTGPPVKLFVNGDASKPGGGTFVNSGSDKRLKSDVTPFTDGLDLLKRLEPINYKYNGKGGIDTSKKHVGLIAQDVLKVFPYMVGTFKSKLQETDAIETELFSLDTNALTYVMVNALKELDERLHLLEKR